MSARAADHDHQAQSEAAAEFPDVPHPLGPLADREIDAIADRQPIDALQDQPEPKARFSSTITGGSPARTATTSQPRTSPFTTYPCPSSSAFTGA